MTFIQALFYFLYFQLFYTFKQIQASKSAYPCNQDCLWDGSSFQKQGFGRKEGCKGMKTKRIHLVISERLLFISERRFIISEE